MMRITSYLEGVISSFHETSPARNNGDLSGHLGGMFDSLNYPAGPEY
jgi:hypothetical protein